MTANFDPESMEVRVLFYVYICTCLLLIDKSSYMNLCYVHIFTDEYTCLYVYICVYICMLICVLNLKEGKTKSFINLIENKIWFSKFVYMHDWLSIHI